MHFFRKFPSYPSKKWTPYLNKGTLNYLDKLLLFIFWSIWYKIWDSVIQLSELVQKYESSIKESKHLTLKRNLQRNQRSSHDHGGWRCERRAGYFSIWIVHEIYCYSHNILLNCWIFRNYIIVAQYRTCDTIHPSAQYRACDTIHNRPYRQWRLFHVFSLFSLRENSTVPF